MDILGLSDLPFLPHVVTRADIPEDLASVQTIEAEAEVDPVEVGLEADAVDRIWGSALRWYRSGIHPALSMCVRVRGQVILKRSLGYSHGGGPGDAPDAPRVKVTPDTPFNIFSASKPMAAMAIHLLDQRGLLRLDDPVCEYIPEFARHGKEWITIRHVLVHRAGIPILPGAALDLDYLEDINTPKAIELLCDAEPTSRAGGRISYHAVTGGFLLGEIVRRVTGRNIRFLVQHELCEPFGWRWMNYGVHRRDVPKVATSYFTGLPLVQPLRAIVHSMLGVDFQQVVELSNDPRFLMGVMPAANLMATADELSQFYQMLLNGGTLNGKRVFDPITVWRATSEQSYGELDFTLGVPLRYGMGFMLGGDYVSLYGYDSHHAFGHLGLTNITAWADPQRHLSVAILNSGKPVLYPELHRALALSYAIAAACPKDASVPPRPKLEPRRRVKKSRTKPTGQPAPEPESEPKAEAKAKPQAKSKAKVGKKGSGRTRVRGAAKPGQAARDEKRKANAAQPARGGKKKEKAARSGKVRKNEPKAGDAASAESKPAKAAKAAPVAKKQKKAAKARARKPGKK